MRSASNGSDFTARVEDLCGLKIEVISGEEEAEIGILGALGINDGGILDIGGASTELIVRQKGDIVYKKSVNVGVVRLKDLCGRDRVALVDYAEKVVQEFQNVPRSKIYAIGGTATSIASIILKQKTYDGQAVTGFALTPQHLLETIDYLTATPVEVLVQETCVPAKRAEVLLGGVIWLLTIVKTLGITELYVSDADNLEGYAMKHGLM